MNDYSVNKDKSRSTEDSRSETAKFPPAQYQNSRKFPFLNTPKQATIELSEVSIPQVLQVFRGLHSAGLQTATVL